MRFIIQGGQSLRGKVKLAGAKNAVTKMMIASLLTDEECVLENIPLIGDLAITVELCQLLGSELRINNRLLKIKTPELKNTEVVSLSRRNRIPILALGPLLIRKGEARVPVLGGDKIGHRPIDIHLDALTKLGAEIRVNENYYEAKAPRGLRGAVINFRYPSVGATENTILAAVLAKGRTVINGAATEPEIIELIKMLQKMGAIIELGSDRKIYIDGVAELRGVRHEIMPDRIEAVSFACLAIATGGEVLIENAVQEHLITFLNTIRRLGADYEVLEKGIRFWRPNKLQAIKVETDTHPGFMTDWQQPLLILLTQAHGRSIIHETVYEDRFGYTKDLNSMGADIKVSTDCPVETPCRFRDMDFKHCAYINGPTRLKGAKLKVPDLRAGMAHIIAACVAEGQSEIDNVEEIDRGYEKIDERLGNLGVKIKRE